MNQTISHKLKKFFCDYCQDRVAMTGLIGMLVIILLALFAPVLAPQNPYDLAQLSIVDGRLPPGTIGEMGLYYWLGTDEQGRDIFSAILYGLRTSLMVGVLSVALALIIGSIYGLIAAYLGGRADTLMMRIVDLQLSIPTILIALVLLAALGKGIDKIIIALVTAQWAMFARTARSSALVEIKKEYIQAARCLRLPHSHILFLHLLPNCLSPLIVLGTITIASAISLEATLSFLGLGVPITNPSLGMLISNGFEYMLSDRYWISTYPGLALLFTIMCINITGDHMRDMLNPRLQH